MKRFFSLLLLMFIGLFSSKGEAKLDPESHAMLSDPKYSKYIEVQCYLVTREQVAEIFGNEKAQAIQKSNNELYQKNLFLLVRCKNKGGYAAFGTLECLPPNCESPTSIDIAMMWPSQESFDDYVIYLGPAITLRNSKLPQITYKWECVYKM
ncbi:MAG: hypothetical protein AB7N99_01325 [Simkaniaceae bacterium]